MIGLGRVPPSPAAPRAPQEVQEPAHVPGRRQLRVPRRPHHRRAKEVPVQVNVVLKARRDQERHANRDVLTIEPVIQVIPGGFRPRQQHRQRGQAPAGHFHPPAFFSHGH
jgi:hypothetical protein